LTCPVTLLLTDNDYVNETYPIFIRNIAGSSAVNTLTIKPAPGKTPLFSTYFVGTLPEYKAMLCLYGARNVILDGSNSGGQDRSMTFRNLGFGGWAAAIGLYNDGKSGASDIVIKNCVVQAHQEAVWNTQCIVTYTVAGDAGYHNITIENNTINSAKYPLQISGTIAHLTTNVRVTGNTIGSMTPNYFTTDIGVIVTQSDSVLIEGNEVIGYADGNSMQFTPVGIGIYDGSTNIRITRNTIHDCYDLISGALGMYINDPGNTNLEVTDNLIYNIKGPGYDLSPVGGGPMGVMVMAGSNMKFYNNTIHMSGDILSPDYPSSSTCIGFGGNGFTILVNDIDLRNNIFLNSMRAVAGDPGSKTYAVTTVSPNCFSVIDHNDYAVNGVGPVVGYLNADRPTLASWQAATGQDTYSVSINPAFVSTTDFHPTAALLNNKGIYLSSLPRDFSGMLRTNPPDVGIYEFGYDPVVMTGLTSANNGSSVTLNGNVTANGEFVTPYFDYGLTTAYGSTLGASPSPVTGTSQTNISADLNSLVPGATYHYRARGVTGPGMIIFGEDKIFTTMPGNLTATGTIANDTCINATQTITAGGAPNNFVVTPAGNVTMIAGHNIIFLPGSVVQQGGYLRGYITSTGQYCGANTPPLVAVRLGNTEEPADLMQSSLKVYPNPTTGTFTLELNGESRDGHASVDIFSMHGDKVFTSEIPRKGKHELSLSGMPAGIYLVRVSGSDLPGLKNPEGTTTQITARIIKQ
jgi:hypothetical protein